MADISIQFYALPAELLAFVKDLVQDFDLHIVTICFRPFSAVEVKRDHLDSLFRELLPRQRIAFTLASPCLPVAHELDFADKNPDHLRLDVGQVNEGLEQSWLSARTENAAAFSIWRKVAKRLEKITEKGVTAVNRETGATGVMRSFRYTSGARDLEASGVRMLSTVGPHGPIVKLGLRLN